jgi:hypothetical protein
MPRPKKKKTVAPMTFTFRISESVRQLLKERAAAEHSSESAVCNRVLENGLRAPSSNLAARISKVEKRVATLESYPRVLGLVLGDTPDKVLALMENALSTLDPMPSSDTDDGEVSSQPKPVKRGRPPKAKAQEEASEADATDDEGGAAGIDN